MKYLIFIFLFITICSSCLQPKYEEQIVKILSNDRPVLDYDSIVIIPRKGCNSCTKEADNYFQKYKDNDRILFIFTNLQNLKLLKIQNGYDIVKRNNVLIDTDNKYFINKAPQADYPGMIYWKDDGKPFHEYLLEASRLAIIE